MLDPIDRRRFLFMSGMLGSGVVAGNSALVAATPGPDAIVDATAAPSSDAPTLCNRPRATEFMQRAGLEALLLAAPMNVYYATGGTPVMSRFTQVNMTAALVPADERQPIAYLGGGFEFYAGVADTGLAAGVQPYLTGGSLGDPDSRSNPAFAVVGDYRFDAREHHRRALLDQTAHFHETMPAALRAALLDRSLRKGTVGFDTWDAKGLLEAVNWQGTLRPADDLILHVRLVKTAPELALMRQAAAANVDAALATAKAARQERSLRNIRQRFFAEAAMRGNVAVYGNVDMVMDERTPGDLREGQTFMIDFVSHHGFYQGDYGRTVFLGDPDRQMRQATDVGIAAWSEIQSRLRPGLRFSEIRQIGNDTVKKLGAPFTYAFNPHSVGLQHWDHPRMTLDGRPLDVALEAGMVLSVDCPLLNAGVNGTTHLEDLVLITASGAKPIHRTGDPFVVI